MDIVEWIRKLPHSPEGHWGMGHLPIVHFIQEEIKPQTMMEIGLNNGTSAAMWLFSCPQVTLMSVDIGIHKFIGEVADIMREQFDDRFFFLETDSMELPNMKFPIYDLIFIDGGHKFEVCKSDLKFSMEHARYILIDDTAGNSPGVNKVLKEVSLESLQLMKRWNIGAGCILYKNLGITDTS